MKRPPGLPPGSGNPPIFRILCNTTWRFRPGPSWSRSRRLASSSPGPRSPARPPGRAAARGLECVGLERTMGIQSSLREGLREAPMGALTAEASSMRPPLAARAPLSMPTLRSPSPTEMAPVSTSSRSSWWRPSTSRRGNPSSRPSEQPNCPRSHSSSRGSLWLRRFTMTRGAVSSHQVRIGPGPMVISPWNPISDS